LTAPGFWGAGGFSERGDVPAQVRMRQTGEHAAGKQAGEQVAGRHKAGKQAGKQAVFRQAEAVVVGEQGGGFGH